MNNLNDLIFKDVKNDFMNQRTRSLFPDTYEEIKQKMIDEYGQIMTRKPQLVFKVIRGEDTRKGAEASFKAEEGGCHVCGEPGHFYRSCELYSNKFSLEANKKHYQKKVKGRRPMVQRKRILSNLLGPHRTSHLASLSPRGVKKRCLNLSNLSGSSLRSQPNFLWSSMSRSLLKLN